MYGPYIMYIENQISDLSFGDEDHKTVLYSSLSCKIIRSTNFVQKTNKHWDAKNENEIFFEIEFDLSFEQRMTNKNDKRSHEF